MEPRRLGELTENGQLETILVTKAAAETGAPPATMRYWIAAAALVRLTATAGEPGVMVTALALRGNPGSMRTYTVSADGKTMTETVVYFTQEGVPAMRTNHFNRVR